MDYLINKTKIEKSEDLIKFLFNANYGKDLIMYYHILTIKGEFIKNEDLSHD